MVESVINHSPQIVLGFLAATLTLNPDYAETCLSMP